jgi:hypothetical protein
VMLSAGQAAPRWPPVPGGQLPTSSACTCVAVTTSRRTPICDR